MQITPTEFVQLPLDGVATELEIRVESFPLFPSQINVFWKVSGINVSKEGSISLPQSIIDVWGTDDTVVKEYVLQQLNLTEAIV
jgi:hypothetical protein